MNQFNDIRKNGAVKIMRDNYLDQMRNIFNELKNRKNRMNLQDYVDKRNQDKIKSILNLMANKKDQLKKNTLDYLRNNNRNHNEGMRQKQQLVNLMETKINKQKRDTLNNLRKVIDDEKRRKDHEDAIIKNISKMMKNSLNNKLKEILNKLRDNNNEHNDRNKRIKNLLQRKLINEN